MGLKEICTTIGTHITNFAKLGYEEQEPCGTSREIGAYIPFDARLVAEWPEPSELAGGDLELKENLVFTLSVNGYFVHTFVPKGFKTDLASDPLDRRGRWDYASVVHDWLYYNKGEVAGYKLTRKECDKVFLYLMEQCNPTGLDVYFYTVKNFTDYFAVRAFGNKAWKDDN